MQHMKLVDVMTRETASNFLLGELIRASTSRFKTLNMAFNRLPQVEQHHILQELEDDCRKAVNEAVDIIASDYRVTFRADCDSVAFKADGVKASLSLKNTEEAHALADAAGCTVMIVIEDASRYLDPGDSTEGEPDEHGLSL